MESGSGSCYCCSRTTPNSRRNSCGSDSGFDCCCGFVPGGVLEDFHGDGNSRRRRRCRDAGEQEEDRACAKEEAAVFHVPTGDLRRLVEEEDGTDRSRDLAVEVRCPGVVPVQTRLYRVVGKEDISCRS
jgi:hypothetical protein